MEINYNDGTKELIDSQFAKEKIAVIGVENELSFSKLVSKLMKDETVKSVSLHKPGSEVLVKPEQTKIIKLNNQAGEIIKFGGRKYFVDENGSWKRVCNE
jgi:hypothetical protein